MRGLFVALAFAIAANAAVLDPDADRVFISEVIEGGSGTSYTKAVELYNPTTDEVAMSGMHLQWFHNGKTTVEANYGLDLDSYTIPAKSTFVICRAPSASQSTLIDSSKCDLSVGYDSEASHAVLHNGNDAIQLMVGGKVTDTVGVVGDSPAGSCWKNEAGTACITKDSSMRRIHTNVGSGNEFIRSQWVAVPVTPGSPNLDDLGVHTDEFAGKSMPDTWEALGGADMCIGDDGGDQYIKRIADCTVQGAKSFCQGHLECVGFVHGFASVEGRYYCFFLTQPQVEACKKTYPSLQGPNTSKANGYLLVREHAYSTCHYENQYESKPASKLHDRECRPITDCTAGEQFQIAAPTPTSNRKCANYRECTEAQYITFDGDAENDRQCATATDCDYTSQWLKAGKTATTNYDCQPISTCPPGKRMVADKTQTSDRTCEECVGEFSYKSNSGNSATCSVCPKGQRANADHTACVAYECDHTTCLHEEHTCWSSNQEVHAGHRTDLSKSVYDNWHALKGYEECDGRKFTTVRVHHHGDESNCAHGHHCAIGAITGSKTKCECAPLSTEPASQLLNPEQ